MRPAPRSLRRTARIWEGLAREDPFLAVCHDPSLSGRRWQPEAFFASGRREVDTVLDHLERIGLRPRYSGRALDFGCGAGRLTQALAERFASCDGVDVAPTMIRLAAEHAPPGHGCRFHLNTSDDLALFDDATFDFVYSSIVLQHLPPELAVGYLREMARVTRPTGIVVAQLLDYEGRGGLKRWRRRLGLSRDGLSALLSRLGLVPDRYRVLMNGVPERRVCETLSAAGVPVVDVALTNSNSPDFHTGLVYLNERRARGAVSKQYTAVKAGERPGSPARGTKPESEPTSV